MPQAQVGVDMSPHRRASRPRRAGYHIQGCVPAGRESEEACTAGEEEVDPDPDSDSDLDETKPQQGGGCAAMRSPHRWRAEEDARASRPRRAARWGVDIPFVLRLAGDSSPYPKISCASCASMSKLPPHPRLCASAFNSPRGGSLGTARPTGGPVYTVRPV